MKWSSLIVTLVCLMSGPLGAMSRSDGAPSGACPQIAPRPSAHEADPQSGAPPYTLDLAQFSSVGRFYYAPGVTYTVRIDSNNMNNSFKGILVQGRQQADGTSPLGTVIVLEPSTTKLSACTPPASAITHTGPELKDSISFNWTAPAAGSGTVQFWWSVVQVRRTYWSSLRSASILEVDSGVTMNSGTASMILMTVVTILFAIM